MALLISLASASYFFKRKYFSIKSRSEDYKNNEDFINEKLAKAL